MKKSILEGNLQILLRSKKGEQSKALSSFFAYYVCNDLYPEWVDCKAKGLWRKEDTGSDKQPDGRFKVWGVYARHHPEEERNEEKE